MIFRAERKDNGQEVKGCHVKIGLLHNIVPIGTEITSISIASRDYLIEIRPETLAMETGIHDKNKKMIFGSFPVNRKMSTGGDSFRTTKNHGFCSNKIVRVEFVDGSFCAVFEKFDELDRIETLIYFSLHYEDSFEIINPQPSWERIEKMDRFDREVEIIENDSNMTQSEKDKAIHEIEKDYGDAINEEQRRTEHEAIDRKYGH